MGRENHEMMLDHCSQTTCLLVSPLSCLYEGERLLGPEDLVSQTPACEAAAP